MLSVPLTMVSVRATRIAPRLEGSSRSLRPDVRPSSNLPAAFGLSVVIVDVATSCAFLSLFRLIHDSSELLSLFTTTEVPLALRTFNLHLTAPIPVLRRSPQIRPLMVTSLLHPRWCTDPDEEF